MSIPAYDLYQGSDSDFFGEVPSHWSVQRLKNSSVINMGQSPNSDDYNIDGDGHGFLQGNADFGDEYPVARSYCPVATKLANPGDILFSVRAPVGAINTADQIYGIGRGLCAITANGSQCSRFLYYSLHLVREALLSIATGSTYEAVTVDQVANAAYLAPPLDEQKAISSFLDVETSKIDGLVSEQRRLIELLKEKRQAVISHAVTKGLNPNAPMKPSGIQWLGDVPQHWEVASIRRISQSVETGGTPSSKSPSEDEADGFLWFTPGDFDDGSIRLSDSKRKVARELVETGDAKTFPPSSVLIVSIGATLGKVGFCSEPCSSNQQINAVIPNDRVEGNFLAYSLSVKAEVMRYLSNASTIGIMNQEKTKVISLAIPPLKEQVDIVDFLDADTARIDTLQAEAERAIELLQERRTALISAAVTGKIDVREFALQETV